MTFTKIGLAGLGVLAGLSTASAQTPPSRVEPNPTAPGTTTPNGVAGGVIRPSRPVDPSMVKRPPTRGQHKMPVIRPPGIAR